MPITETDRTIERVSREIMVKDAAAPSPLPAARMSQLWPQIAPKIRDIAAARGTVTVEDLRRLGLSDADIEWSSDAIRREAQAATRPTKRIRRSRRLALPAGTRA